MKQTNRSKRALTIENMIDKKRDLLGFDGQWLMAFGNPEATGSWLIWGNSGNGKTRFCMQLAKYLCRFGKVLYNSIEEGDSASIIRAMKDENMIEVNNRFLFLDREPMTDMLVRLRKSRNLRFVFIDSLQYSGLNAVTYKQMVNEFRDKMFVIISHAEGTRPDGRLAKKIEFDAFIKTRIEGFKCFTKSRYGVTDNYVIWHEGAQKYWGV